ncbi:MAG: CAP domain-containing protein [Planctomycetes bacterium]|nr:CAP domain-containing protein [Planctomycetota bacterium]
MRLRQLTLSDSSAGTRRDWAFGLKGRLATFALLATSLACWHPARAQFAEEADSDALSEEVASNSGQSVSSDGVSQSEREKVEQGILERLNRFRKEHDLGAVKSNPKLEETALDFARFMARTDKYGHTADGNRPAERAKNHGYDYCLVLENIAYRFRSTGFSSGELAEGFHTGWVESKGHRENMLDPDVTEVGHGLARSEDSGKYYAVQLFGRPKSEQIEFSVVNRSGVELEYKLGEESFTLPPRFRRSHMVCRPRALVLPTGMTDAAKPATKSFTPEGGEQFFIESADGKFSIRTETAGS